MYRLLIVLCSVAALCAAQQPALGFVVDVSVVSAVGASAAQQIMSTVDNTHPPPYVHSTSSATVTFSNFVFDVFLQAFALAPQPGFLYFEEGAQFHYHIQQSGFPGISQSGDVYIFTVNQNQKTLQVGLSTNFEGSTPSVTVQSAAINVEQGDLWIVGTCTDTICLIPVSDIVDPIAQNLIPGLDTAIQTGVQEAANAFVAKLKDVYVIPIGASHFLEFSAQGALITLPDGSLAYTASGAVLSDVNGKWIAPPVANTVPLPPLSSLPPAQYKFVASNWVYESFFWALGSQGLLSFSLSEASVPPSFPIKLTTDNSFWKGAVPGLSKYPHQNLSLAFAPLSVWPDVSIQANDQLVIGPISFSMTMSVVNNTGVVVANAVTLNITMTMQLSVSATLGAGNAVVLSFGIQNHNDTVQLLQSRLGSVSVAAFDAIIQFAFLFAKIPPLTLHLPSDFQATVLALQSGPGYFVLLADAQLPAPTSRRPRDVFRAMQGERKTMEHDAAKFIPSFSLKRSSREVSNATAPVAFRPDDVQLCGPGTSSCEADYTCCSDTSGGYACCPTPHGTCCSDKQHCCPSGYGCADANTECEPF